MLSRCVVRCVIESVAIRLAGCLSGMRGSIRASCSAPPFRSIHNTLSLVYSPVPTGTTAFIPPRFGDADANTVNKSNLFQRRYVPLQKQGNRFSRVDYNADVGVLMVEEEYKFHIIGCGFHHFNADVI